MIKKKWRSPQIGDKLYVQQNQIWKSCNVSNHEYGHDYKILTRLSKYNAQITSIYSVFVTKMIKKSMFNIAEESTCLKVPYWHSRLRFFAIFQKTIKQVNKNENCSVSNRQPKFLVIYNIARLQQKVVKKVYSFHFWKN